MFLLLFKETKAGIKMKKKSNFKFTGMKEMLNRDQMKSIKGGNMAGSQCVFGDCSVFDGTNTHKGQCYSEGWGSNACYCHTEKGPSNYPSSQCIH